MAIPLNPKSTPRQETFPEKSDQVRPNEAAAETASAAPESNVPIPEGVESGTPEILAAKREEIKAEQTGEAPSAAAMSSSAAMASPVKAYVSPADLKNLESLPREEQVKYLTEIVYQKGLERAIAAVQHLHDPYLLDLLHDTLVDELYQKLKGPRIAKK